MIAGREVITKIGLILLHDPLGLRLLALIIGLGIVVQAVITDMSVITAMRASFGSADPVPKIAGLSAVIAKNHRRTRISKPAPRLKTENREIMDKREDPNLDAGRPAIVGPGYV